MRTRIIPAQITTVEDKIAGNFSLTQIVMLLTPVLFATLVFVFMPPSMIFVLYKLTLTGVYALISTVLAIRVKNKLVIEWFVILLKFNLRPKYYIFNKNSKYEREIIKEFPEKKVQEENIQVHQGSTFTLPSIKDVLALDQLLAREDVNLTYKAGRNGGLHVAFEKVSK